MAKAPPAKSTTDTFADKRSELLGLQLQLNGLARTEGSLLDELSKFEQLKAELVLEATQIKKMMFAHEELQLFSPNTCPYCLHEVDRIPDRCVCGREIKEGEYEKFFYDAKEYLAILKSRQKNVETVDIAASSVRQELIGVRASKDQIEARAKEIASDIEQAVADSDVGIDLQRFDEVDRQLSGLKNEISRLEQQRELESRRESLERDHRTASDKYDELKTEVTQLQAAAELDIQQKRLLFSKKYSEIMRSTVADCRVASIDSDYMPIINGGEYREASADVPRRLLYYATLLYVSIIDNDAKFPRFLLVDTPETAGIDEENLKNALTRLLEIITESNKLKRPVQVILTTGLGKYPESAKPYVFGTLRKGQGQRLLKPKVVV